MFSPEEYREYCAHWLDVELDIEYAWNEYTRNDLKFKKTADIDAKAELDVSYAKAQWLQQYHNSLQEQADQFEFFFCLFIS